MTDIRREQGLHLYFQKELDEDAELLQALYTIQSTLPN